MELEDKVWLAGFIDGEGHIGLSTKGPKHFQTVLKIQTTHEPTMKYVADLLHCPLSTVYTDHPIWKNSYRAAIYDKKAAEVLKEVLPYLKTKKEQAEVIFKFREAIKPGKNQFSSTSEEDYSKQHACYLALHELNKRGK
jgi:hypothetical protein